MVFLREFSAEGGVRYVLFGKVLPRGGKSGAAIWGRDLGTFGCNVEKSVGRTCGFPTAVDSEEEEKTK